MSVATMSRKCAHYWLVCGFFCGTLFWLPNLLEVEDDGERIPALLQKSPSDISPHFMWLTLEVTRFEPILIGRILLISLRSETRIVETVGLQFSGIRNNDIALQTRSPHTKWRGLISMFIKWKVILQTPVYIVAKCIMYKKILYQSSICCVEIFVIIFVLFIQCGNFIHIKISHGFLFHYITWALKYSTHVIMNFTSVFF